MESMCIKAYVWIFITDIVPISLVCTFGLQMRKLEQDPLHLDWLHNWLILSYKVVDYGTGLWNEWTKENRYDPIHEEIENA